MGISRGLAYGAFFLAALTFSSSAIAARTSPLPKKPTISYNEATGVYEIHARNTSRPGNVVPFPSPPPRTTVPYSFVLDLARKAFSWQTSAAVAVISIIGTYLADKYSDVHIESGDIVGTPVLKPKIVGDEQTGYITSHNACSIISPGDFVIDAATGHTWTIQRSYWNLEGATPRIVCLNLPVNAEGVHYYAFEINHPYNPYENQKPAPVVIPPSEYLPAIDPHHIADLANSVPYTDPAWSPIADAVYEDVSTSTSLSDGSSSSSTATTVQLTTETTTTTATTTTNSDGATTTSIETNDVSTSTSLSDGSSFSPIATTGQLTTETTTTTTTTTTNSDGATTTSIETNVTTDVKSISMEWPSFCSWAGLVCSAIDWIRSPPDEPEVPDLPHQEIDVGTLTHKFDSGLGGGSCPAPVSVAFMGQTLTFSYDSACWAASSVFRPILLSSAFIIAGFTLMGRSDLT